MGSLGEAPFASVDLAQATLDLLETGLIGIDATGKIQFWNDWISKRSGIGAAEAIGRSYETAFAEPIDARLSDAIRAALESGLPARFSYALHPHPLPLHGVGDDGRIKQKVSVLPVFGPGGSRWCLVQIADMSEVVERERFLRRQARELAIKVDSLVEAQEELRRSEARFRELAGGAPVGIFETDGKGDCIFVNAHWSQMTGLNAEQSLGAGWLEVIVAEERKSLLDGLLGARDKTGHFSGDFRYRNPNTGAVRWIRIDAVPVRGAHAASVAFIGTAIDVHQEREAAMRDAFNAHHDALTGMANRVQFDIEMQSAIVACQGGRMPFAILFFDLDGFKLINDLHGHEAGDTVLREVARRLRATLRSSDVVARLGGDEFVALLHGVSAESELARVVASAEQAVGKPIHHGALVLHARCSIGSARYPEHGADAATLLHHADQRMYERKRARREARTG